MKYVSCADSVTVNCKAARTRIDDITMYFQVYGEGSPLLLLHPTGAYIETFDNQIPALAERFQVIAPDLRASGRTTDSDKPLAPLLLASDMIELLDQLKLDRAHVVGWSGGGRIGLDLAINYPERISKLVVIACVFSPDGFTEEFKRQYGDLTAEGMPPGMVDFYQRNAPDPSHLPVLVEKLKRLWFAPAGYMTKDELSSIEVSTLLLIGEADEYVRQEHFVELQRLIPGSRLVVIADAGHNVPWQQPESVNTAILTFLREH